MKNSSTYLVYLKKNSIERRTYDKRSFVDEQLTRMPILFSMLILTYLSVVVMWSYDLQVTTSDELLKH